MIVRKAKTRAKLLIFGLILLSGALTVACGEQAPVVTPVSFTLTEFAFDPAEVTVPAGTVEFTLENTGAIEHNFAIEGLNDEEPQYVYPTATANIEMDLDPGVYTFYCTISGHKEAGMTGTLTVAE